MLASNSLSLYTHKSISRLGIGLRFLAFLLLVGLCPSELWAHIIIDTALDGAVDYDALINSASIFSEMGAPASTGVNRYLSVGVLYFANSTLGHVEGEGDTRELGELEEIGSLLGHQLIEPEAIAFWNASRTINRFGEPVVRFGTSEVPRLKEAISIVVINGSEVIDFEGGDPENPNIFEASMLVIPTDEDRLFIKNWSEYSDYFLVSREFTPSEEVLSRIQFEGYERGAKVRYYNDTHWEIVPASEAAIYGATLGAAALGTTAWRKRRRSSALFIK